MTDWIDAISNLHDACRNVFGTQVAYIPSVEKRPEYEGIPIEITAIFDDNREVVDISAVGVDVVARRTVLDVILADLGIEPKEGDAVEINGVTYQVVDVQPDGYGSSVLVLSQERAPF